MKTTEQGILLMVGQSVRYWIVILSFLVSCFSYANETSKSQLKTLALDAYVYYFPLVTMDLTRRQMCLIRKKQGTAGVNQFSHRRAYPDANFKGVVRPNFDTLYSSAWVDVSKEPIILSSEDVDGRYFLLPIMDMWTDVFASPGRRTTGTGPQSYAIVSSTFNGELPNNVIRIDAPTDDVWIIGRTQTNGEGDYKNVHILQDGFRLTPLSQMGETSPVPASCNAQPVPLTQTIPEIIAKMKAEEYFEYASQLVLRHRPHKTDWTILSQLQQLGLNHTQTLDFSSLKQDQKEALNYATNEGIAYIRGAFAKSCSYCKRLANERFYNRSLWKPLSKTCSCCSGWIGCKLTPRCRLSFKSV